MKLLTVKDLRFFLGQCSETPAAAVRGPQRARVPVLWATVVAALWMGLGAQSASADLVLECDMYTGDAIEAGKQYPLTELQNCYAYSDSEPFNQNDLNGTVRFYFRLGFQGSCTEPLDITIDPLGMSTGSEDIDGDLKPYSWVESSAANIFDGGFTYGAVKYSVPSEAAACGTEGNTLALDVKWSIDGGAIASGGTHFIPVTYPATITVGNLPTDLSVQEGIDTALDFRGTTVTTTNNPNNDPVVLWMTPTSFDTSSTCTATEQEISFAVPLTVTAISETEVSGTTSSIATVTAYYDEDDTTGTACTNTGGSFTCNVGSGNYISIVASSQGETATVWHGLSAATDNPAPLNVGIMDTASDIEGYLGFDGGENPQTVYYNTSCQWPLESGGLEIAKSFAVNPNGAPDVVGTPLQIAITKAPDPGAITFSANASDPFTIPGPSQAGDWSPIDLAPPLADFGGEMPYQFAGDGTLTLVVEVASGSIRANCAGTGKCDSSARPGFVEVGPSSNQDRTFTIVAAQVADLNGLIEPTLSPKFFEYKYDSLVNDTVTLTLFDESGGTAEATLTILAPDSTPPAAPILTSATKGTDGKVTVVGTAEAGATVEVTFGDDSKEEGTAESDGSFSVTSDDVQANTSVSVTATDLAGNTSDPTTRPDETSPADPVFTRVVQSADGKMTATGTAEAGTTVTVTFPGGSGTDVVGADGLFSVTSSAVQTATSPVTAQASDGVTTPRDAVTFTGDVEDERPPAAPTLTSATKGADGRVTVVGTAEAGAAVNVTFGDGSLGLGTAASDGSFSVTSDDVQANTSVSVTATDAAGNTSIASTLTDTTPPADPVFTRVVQSADGKMTATGTAEPGTTVTVTFPDSSTGTDVVGADGLFSVTSSAAQTATSPVKAQAYDGASTPRDAVTFTGEVETVPDAPTSVSLDGNTLTLTAASGGTIKILNNGVDVTSKFTIVENSGTYTAVAKAGEFDGESVSLTATVTVDGTESAASSPAVTGTLNTTSGNTDTILKKSDDSTMEVDPEAVTGDFMLNEDGSLEQGKKDFEPEGEGNYIEIQDPTTPDSDIKLRLEDTPSASNTDPAEVSDIGVMTFYLGNTGTASGSGFAPGSTAEVWLFSDPIYLGETPVLSDGTWSLEFDVPDDLPTGNHTIQAQGVLPNGNRKAASAGVVVSRATGGGGAGGGGAGGAEPIPTLPLGLLMLVAVLLGGLGLRRLKL